MKYVKCDKCGKTISISCVDNDYICDGEYYWLISEQTICGKEYDLCKDCYNTLQNKKYLVEEDFVRDIKKEKNND